MKITIESYSSIAGCLCSFLASNNGVVITKNAFARSAGDQKCISRIAGVTKSIDWDSFKLKLQEYLQPFGFVWKATQGQSGPLRLEKVTLPKELGIQSAKNRFKTVETGDLLAVMRADLSEVFRLVPDNDPAQIDFSLFREGFQEYSENNRSYKFKRGRSSTAFYRAIREYTYGSQSKAQDEVKLGEAIKDLLARKLQIQLYHAQSERAGAKYQNVDFIGYRILKDIHEDSVDIYAFELKASNKIASVSEAISQAVNYTAFANFSYIVIPMFDEGNFYDEDRFNTYLQLCESNDLGVISIDIDVETNEINDVYEIHPPRRREVLEAVRVRDFMQQNGFEFCPLCRRIVDQRTREGCEWLVSVPTSTDAEDSCMKQLMERKFSGA